jgi:hypothetical protein
MANLVVLTLGDGRTFRCVDLDDAKEKAISKWEAIRFA